MDKSRKWKGEQAASTLESFFSQFGPIDDHKRVVLEIFFEELYGKAVSVPSPKGSEGDHAIESIPSTETSVTNESPIDNRLETAWRIDEADSGDNPSKSNGV